MFRFYRIKRSKGNVDTMLTLSVEHSGLLPAAAKSLDLFIDQAIRNAQENIRSRKGWYSTVIEPCEAPVSISTDCMVKWPLNKAMDAIQPDSAFSILRGKITAVNVAIWSANLKTLAQPNELFLRKSINSGFIEACHTSKSI